jgi:hypothetical protein
MEVASLQQRSLHAEPSSTANAPTTTTMDASMDIDMDLDLGPLPEPEHIDIVSLATAWSLFLKRV